MFVLSLSGPSCNVLGTFILIFMAVFTISTLVRLPNDLAELRRHYLEKNWPELRISLLAASAYWFATLFFLSFFYSAYTLPNKSSYG